MKTLIISDNPFELAVLAQALIHHDVTVAGQASNPIDALNVFKTVNPDSVIIDIRFNENNAIKLCKEFREIDPLIGLVVITDSPDLRILGLTLSILPSGAQLVLKSSNNVIGLLCQAIELSIDAASTKSASMWIQGDNLYSHKLFASVLSGLTDIQIETLSHVGNGLSNSEISKVRFVTEKSVEQIVTKISQHFGVGSDPTKNQRVLLAGEYFKWIGAIRH